MALTIQIPDPTAAAMVTVRGLWLTADRQRVVKSGDPAAAFSLGNQVTIAEAQRLGLLPGALDERPADAQPATKQAAPSANKQAKAPANKARRQRPPALSR